MSPGAVYRSANLKRDDKADRKDDAKKGEDGSGEKSKDQDDQKPGPSERSRTTKSGSRGTERTVVMDKSKGVPVISVKTSGSKERVSIHFLTRVFYNFISCDISIFYISLCILGIPGFKL